MESYITDQEAVQKAPGLSWNLDHDRTTVHIITPFKYLTSPLPPHLQPFQSDFHQFSRFSLELQQLVAHHVDVATSWQLMRTTSSMRRIAKTRFWEDEGLYYRVCGSWLQVFLGFVENYILTFEKSSNISYVYTPEA